MNLIKQARRFKGSLLSRIDPAKYKEASRLALIQERKDRGEDPNNWFNRMRNMSINDVERLSDNDVQKYGVLWKRYEENYYLSDLEKKNHLPDFQ
jgi:hypothetical protein